MRRRSSQIPACLILLASAATLSGCDERRDCVDPSGRKLPDSTCNAAGHGGGARYIYGGRGGSSVGDSVEGGSTSPSVSRGGFGGGGGEGEGE